MAHPLPLPADLLDVSAVARLWQVHVSCVYRQLHSGKLIGYRIGGRWKVSRSDAVGFVKRTGGPAEVSTGQPGRVPRMGHDAAMDLLRRAGVIKD